MLAMQMDAFSAKKRRIQVDGAWVAYYEEGSGPPLLLLHGCPFSSFVWRKVIPRLAPSYQYVAPHREAPATGTIRRSIFAQAHSLA